MSSTIALFAATYPLQSETFVYRDVEGLRRAGRKVTVVALRRGTEPVEGMNGRVAPADLCVYGPGFWPTVAASLAEALTHPVRWLRTQVRALLDAFVPGEPTGLASRLKLPLQAFLASGLARRLRRAGVGHLHAHFAHAPATFALYASKHLGLPFSFVGHANDLFQRRVLLRRKLQRSAFVSCISEWHREFYRQIEPGSASRCRVIRCGVDTAAWAPSERRAVAGGKARLLTVGRLVEKKGVDTLLRALGELRREGADDWTLSVVGDGPFREPWQGLAAQLGCADRVRWLGSLDNDRVRGLMGEADLFVLPCRPDSQGDRDGVPVVLMEAMASGLPVISGDLPAIRELVKDGVTGRLVDGTQPGDLARTIRELTADAAVRDRLAKAGRARVEEEFSATGNLERLMGAMSEGPGT